MKSIVSKTLTPLFFFKDWINEQWEEKYYISALAGADNGCSLVVMSKGMQYYVIGFISLLILLYVCSIHNNLAKLVSSFRLGGSRKSGLRGLTSLLLR